MRPAIQTTSMQWFGLPPLKIEEVDGFRVVRDDQVAGGTKVRVLMDVLSGISEDEVVYASHPYGYGAFALALACKKHGKRLTLFYPRILTLPKPMILAVKQPHVTHRVFSGLKTQAEAYGMAEEYCRYLRAHLMPIGFEFPDFFEGLVSVVRALGITPNEAWAVAGSGCLVRAMHKAWPNACINAVSLGFDHVDVGACKMHVAPEAPEQTAEIIPPYPSADFYDAKVWRFVKQYAEPGAVVWNVAG